MTDNQRTLLEEGCAQLESRAGLVWGPEFIEEFAAALRALLAEVAALKAERDPLAEMWRELEAYQEQANTNGHGKSWWRMCKERTEAAAREAAVDVAAAKAARDAAAWAADAAIQLGNAGQEWAESAITAIRRAKEARP